MNPMKNVTDPQSIKASEMPSRNDANPAGEIGGVAAAALRREEDTGGGSGRIAGE